MLKKIITLFFTVLFMSILIFGLYNYLVKKHNDREKVLMVKEYIQQKYSINCEIKNIRFQHYSYGFTGGLYMYEFTCVDENGKTFLISYKDYFDLNEYSLTELKLIE